MIVNFAEQYTDGIVALWNRTAAADGYKEMDRRRFAEIFVQNSAFHPDTTFVRVKNGAVEGFACGCVGDDLPWGGAAGYITCILVAPEAQGSGAFGELLARLEQSFRDRGRRRADVLFFNPILLPWYIPGQGRREHNNAPGAMAGSYFHRALLRCGYAERARECAMYLDLAEFVIPEDIRQKEREAARAGYEVALFDPTRHRGVPAMLRTLHNPLWQEEIARCAADGTPVLVAARGGGAVGFAGPLVRQENGRGYFSGIGVAPAHEGHGLGTVLFFRLCEGLRRVGAEYMSLYTGEDNRAKNIYLKAGFRPVKQFVILRRELDEAPPQTKGSAD